MYDKIQYKLKKKKDNRAWCPLGWVREQPE